MQTGRKSTQRERLIAGVIAVANRAGYGGTSVAAIAAEAKVSKPTFYDYFEDRDDGFLKSLADVQAQLLEHIRPTLEASPPEQATAAAIRVIVDFAAAHPARARFLTNEPLAGGKPALESRDQAIDQIAADIATTREKVAMDVPTPDVPLPIVIGGVCRLLAARLRRGERATEALSEDLATWVASYETQLSRHRWHAMSPMDAPSLSPYLPKTPLRAPEALPPGRPRLSAAEVEENQRLRIIFAAARLADEKGYSATTITDIAKRARVDLRAFYALFSDKQEAFMSVHELGFQELMAVSAGAFFAGSRWPERSWEAGRAFTQFLEANPTIAHVGFVEAYAVGPGAVQRVEDSHVAFTIFLHEGMQHITKPNPPSRVVLEAIVSSIFEVVYRRVRAGKPLQIAGTLPRIAHLWLTPFLGPEEATAFILEASASTAASAAS